jgi:acetylornithine deacetylase
MTSRELLEKLVAFDTTSRNSNLALINFVRDYLDRLGVPSRLVTDEAGGKANLYATLGREDIGGIMLSGHTDCVPVEGQAWSSDPFALIERDGRYYGRGTADMKSFIACCLALAPEFLARPATALPVHLALSYDEEVGMLGAKRLITQMRGMSVRPQRCVVGEPTDMQVIVAHKGKLSVRCEVKGLECHSALTHAGVNAVEAAAEVVAYLKKAARRFREEGPFDADYSPPYATVHTGTIRGGVALNIVPKECSFSFEFRFLPQQDPEAFLADVMRYAETTLLPEMRAVFPGAAFIWHPLSEYPALTDAENKSFAQVARALCGCLTSVSGKVSFGTEAGLFQELGMAAIVCGPGSIEQAHKPDEYVAVSQVAACEDFLRRLVLPAMPAA